MVAEPSQWPLWIQAAASVGSLFVAIALAVLTWFYLTETRRMVGQAQERALPELIGRIEPYHNLYAQFVVTNIGAGAARDVFLRMELGSHTSVWSHTVFEPGRAERFFLPAAPGANSNADLFETLAAADSELVVTLKYSDRSGTEHDASIPSIRLADLVKRWRDARWLQVDSELFDIGQKIQDELHAIVDAVTQLEVRKKGLRGPT